MSNFSDGQAKEKIANKKYINLEKNPIFQIK
jgi:hypothetical protein